MEFIFLVTARRVFDPLADRFGMHYVSGSEWQLRYENDAAFLSIHFDNHRSYEIGVETGQLATQRPERPFNLSEVLRLRGVSSESDIDGFQVKNQTELDTALMRLARLTSTFASDFLRGNPRAFCELGKLRDLECQEYAKARDLRVARITAEQAWAESNYAKFIEICAPRISQLTNSEKKKLEYARKHLVSFDTGNR